MAVTHPTPSRNWLADAHDDYTNQGVGTAIFRLRDGLVTIVDFNLQNPAYGLAVNAIITLAGTPIAAVASGTGDVDNYQVINRNGDVAHQGSVTLTGGGGDVEMDNTNVVITQNASLDAFTYEAPP